MSRTAALRKSTAATTAALAIALDRVAIKKNEIYIGAIVGPDLKGHHIILLAGDESKNWKDAMAWAKKQGGDLPDRVEQALLFRDHKDKFKPSWYWSNTPYAGLADYAWIQDFYYGYTRYDPKSYDYRCRAVRRVAI